MGEVKRYCCTEDCGNVYMTEWRTDDKYVTHDNGTLYVSQEDYDTLRAEVERLREYKESMAAAIEEDRPEWKRLHDIEVAARDMLAKLDSEGYSGHYMRALAEACGRKG